MGKYIDKTKKIAYIKQMEGKMNLEKIRTVLSINHDGTIMNIEKENNDLNIDIEIEYLAELFNKTFSLMRYKLINFNKIEFIYGDNKCKNLSDIKNMELDIYDAKIGENESVIVQTCSDKDNIPYGELFIWADDIKIYDQNYCEIEYSKLFDKKMWDDWEKILKNNLRIKIYDERQHCT
jgi:hypothetical protein